MQKPPRTNAVQPNAYSLVMPERASVIKIMGLGRNRLRGPLTFDFLSHLPQFIQARIENMYTKELLRGKKISLTRLQLPNQVHRY